MHRRLRISAIQISLRSQYSTSAPLITVTNVPAPNTGHIRVLELNRPAARNAISRSLLAALRTEVDGVHAQYGPDGEELPAKKIFGGAAGADEKGPTRALILASAVDSCFCAGADLKERRGFTKEEYALRTTIQANWPQFLMPASLPGPPSSSPTYEVP